MAIDAAIPKASGVAQTAHGPTKTAGIHAGEIAKANSMTMTAVMSAKTHARARGAEGDEACREVVAREYSC